MKGLTTSFSTHAAAQSEDRANPQRSTGAFFGALGQRSTAGISDAAKCRPPCLFDRLCYYCELYGKAARNCRSPCSRNDQN